MLLNQISVIRCDKIIKMGRNNAHIRVVFIHTRCVCYVELQLTLAKYVLAFSSTARN